MKNDSGVSGEHNLSPATEILSPDLDGLSPEGLKDMSTKSVETGHTGDKYRLLIDKQKGSRISQPKNYLHFYKILKHSIYCT